MFIEFLLSIYKCGGLCGLVNKVMELCYKVISIQERRTQLPKHKNKKTFSFSTVSEGLSSFLGEISLSTFSMRIYMFARVFPMYLYSPFPNFCVNLYLAYFGF